MNNTHPVEFSFVNAGDKIIIECHSPKVNFFQALHDNIHKFVINY